MLGFLDGDDCSGLDVERPIQGYVTCANPLSHLVVKFDLKSCLCNGNCKSGDFAS